MTAAWHRQAARQDWGRDDTGCTILHVDMDAFFAEVELLDHPHLRGQPVIVGGQQRGVVLSATYEARRYGVHSAMPMAQARAACPTAVVLAPHHSTYVEYSQRVMHLLHEVTPTVEQVSVDEAFLDVAGARRRLGPPADIAAGIRSRVRAELGLPASVGIAATKFVAKLASSHAKPDGTFLVAHEATVPFVHSLPVESMWGVGAATAAILHRRGIRTVAELAKIDPDRLRGVVGSAAGSRLHELANGRDGRAVETNRVEKSIGTETTFDANEVDDGVLRAVLLEASHRCAARLRRAGRLARTISIKVRHADFTTLSRSTTVPGTDVAQDVFTAASHLLDGLTVPVRGLRLLGVRAANLIDAQEGYQPSLDEAESRRDVETTMDGIRARFGATALRPATLLGPGRNPGPAPGNGTDTG